MNKLQISKNLMSNYTTSYNKRKFFSILDKCGVDINNSETPRKYINDLIYKNYHNEKIIKTSFIKNFLINKSLKTIGIYEMKSNNSRLDLCTIDEKYSTVYEIKTELLQDSRHNLMITTNYLMNVIL